LINAVCLVAFLKKKQDEMLNTVSKKADDEREKKISEGRRRGG
jgi:hypothetical protein